MSEWVGVRFVALAELRWSHSGELFIMHPGDEFELDEADIEKEGMDPARWLAAGNVLRAEDWPVYLASLSEDERLKLDETAIASHERRDEEIAEAAKDREARQRVVSKKADKSVTARPPADAGPPADITLEV